MANPFRNLRLPGSKPRRYRGAPTRPMATRGTRAPQRTYALARAERPKERRSLVIPWRRLGITSVAVALVVSMVYGTAWLVTGDTLRVQAVDVSGAQVTDPHLVAEVAAVGRESLLTVDLNAATEAIAALPAVKSVTVTRNWPQQVDIAIEEHQAWGYWQSGGRVFVIDRDGNVLQAYRPASANAPTIIDLASPRDAKQVRRVGDPDTVRLVARLVDERVFESAGMEPSAWVFQRDRGLTVIAQDGPDAVFGDSSNYEFKVQAFEQVLRELQARANTGSPQVAEIDLRFGRNV
ncbi:MAG: FtsQ-type POTRA domain-containing protein, partial [Chloroflexi bacterium]|nr:FtsQ-type POTRA domain-containing protein [Chloroflexota bacterium]